MRRITVPSRRAAILAASFAIAWAAACAPSTERDTVAVGSPAPDYSAVMLDGDSVSLRALRGRVVLLNIWATWCAPCRDEIPQLQALHQRYGRDGLDIIGVSVDARGEEGRVGAYTKAIGMTYPVWHDPDERVSRLYRAIGVPASYLIDREGVLRWRRIGPIIDGDTVFARVLGETLMLHQGEGAVSSAR